MTPARAADQRLDQLAGGRIEVRAGLVEQQQLGRVQDGARDVSRWTMPRLSERTGSSARSRMPTASSSSSTRSRRDPMQARVVDEVLAPGQVAVQQRLVSQQPDAAAHLPALARQRLAEQLHAALVRAQQRRQDPQQRRLAGAVAAEHRERLPGGERQRDVAQHRALTEVARQAVELG